MEISTETKFQSEIAALQYKNERLTKEQKELQEVVKQKEEKIIHQHNVGEELRETNARYVAINQSLQRKLEENESLQKSQKSEIEKLENEVKKIKQEKHDLNEKIIVLEALLRTTTIKLETSENSNEALKRNQNEYFRKIASAIDFNGDPDALLKKIYDLYEETARSRLQISNLKQVLETNANELKSDNEFINRLNNEKDSLNQQIVGCLGNLESLRKEKDHLAAENSFLTNELSIYKDKCSMLNRSLSLVNEQSRELESKLFNMKETLQNSECSSNKAEKELRQFQESIAIQLSTGSKVIEIENIREAINSILTELRDKNETLTTLREKIARLQTNIERLESQTTNSMATRDEALSEKINLKKKLEETEANLGTMEILIDGLRRDKLNSSTFLSQLASILQISDLSDLGPNLLSDAILTKAQKLTNFETSRLADKTSQLHILQRKIHTLKLQLEKKELHVDLLRKKLSTLEDSIKHRSNVESEKEEANTKLKKLKREAERLELELRSARELERNCRGQLVDAAGVKLLCLERGQRIGFLEEKVNDLELLRVKYNRKINVLKEEMRRMRESYVEEREISDRAFEQLRLECAGLKRKLEEVKEREGQLLNLRGMVGRILGIDWSKSIVPDYELINKLEKVMQTNKEFAQVSKKLSDSMKLLPEEY